jgi:hypothetical protein
MASLFLTVTTFAVRMVFIRTANVAGARNAHGEPFRPCIIAISPHNGIIMYRADSHTPQI